MTEASPPHHPQADPQSHGGRARFLFRQDQGCVPAATWRLHAGWLFAVFVALTLIWFALKPYAHHDLARQAFIAPLTILAFAFLLIYTFATLLMAVSYVMLSMKRCRDRDLPVGLSALAPLLAFLAASLHFLHAQTPDVILVWHVVALDAALVCALVWTVAALGFDMLPARAPAQLRAPPV